MHAPGGAGKKGLAKTQIQQKDVDRIKAGEDALKKKLLEKRLGGNTHVNPYDKQSVGDSSNADFNKYKMIQVDANPSATAAKKGGPEPVALRGKNAKKGGSPSDNKKGPASAAFAKEKDLTSKMEKDRKSN